MGEEAQYKIAFTEHPVHENLERLKKQAADLPAELLEAALEHDAPALLPRLEPAIEFVGALLASADTALVTQQMLNDLNESIQQISSALTPFKDNTDFEQMPTIQSGIEALLNRSLRMAPAIGVWARTDARKAAAQLGEASTEKTRQLQQQASDLQGQLNRLLEEAGEASELVKTASEERINELQAQLDTIKAEAEAERTKVQEAMDGFGTQFSSEQENRATEFQNNKQELTEKAEQAIEEFKTAAAEATSKDQERADATVTDLELKSGRIIDALEEQREKATRLVDLVATSSTAGAFGKEAKAQKEQADRWRRNALIGGAFAAVVALAAIALSLANVGDLTDEANASSIVAKVAAVTLLLGIAGYAAGQSGQHRCREQRAKRLELELIAFDPFTEPLADEEKNAVRKAFIERLFVGDPGEDHKDGDVKIGDENLSAFLKLVDLIRSTPGSTP